MTARDWAGTAHRFGGVRGECCFRLWDNVDYALPGREAGGETGDQSLIRNRDELKQFWRWRRVVLDVAGVAFWLYALLKVFVTNIDDALLGGLADYRFFFFLGAAALLAAYLKKTPQVLLGFSYVLCFPIVVFAWELPRRLFKTRSSIAFLAAGNALTSIVGDIRHSVITAGEILALKGDSYRLKDRDLDRRAPTD